MKLNETQLKEIEENGYVILPDCFSNEEVNNLRKAMTTVFKEKTEANIIEKSSGVVLTAMGLHLRSMFLMISHMIRFIGEKSTNRFQQKHLKNYLKK